MSEWEIVRHQVAIAGRVTDAQTDRAIAGARVSLGTGPETFTAADGHFHFLDLSAGEYTLKASLPGAGTRYGPSDEVTVNLSSPGAEGKIAMKIADIALPSTTVKGQVKEAGGPVAMAKVRVQGSGERTYSDEEGNYMLTALEKGKRTIVASAQGYSDASRVVEIGEAGLSVTGVDLTLTPPGASRRVSRS